MTPNHWRAAKPGMSRSTAFAAEIETIFATSKRKLGLRRMRRRGLAKAGLQIRFTAIVSNIKRCSRIVAPASESQDGKFHATSLIKT